MSSGVKDTDKGYKAFFARVKDAKGLVLTVGVHGPEGAEPHEGTPALTVVDVATIHEFGLGHNPERSFVRGWYDEKKAENEETLRKIGQALVKGQYPAQQGLERAGAKFVAGIQNRIVAGISPPLDPRTIARKGSSIPLINTGQMKSSVRFRVERKK